MKKFLCFVMLAGMALMLVPAMHATSITGGISFGSTTPFTWNGTGVTFPAGPNANVTSVTGSYVGNVTVTSTPLITFNSFTFAGGASPVWTNGVNASFDLSGPVTVDANTSHLITVEGTGILHLTGFDDTPGSFFFSGNSAGGTFSFSASSAATPEPASLLLLGTGLSGLLAFKRRKL